LLEIDRVTLYNRIIRYGFQRETPAHGQTKAVRRIRVRAQCVHEIQKSKLCLSALLTRMCWRIWR
jgi:hypothetical protein